MKIIFPMAGMGSRFKNAGFEKEKYEIDAFGKTLFEYSVESLIAFNDGVNEFIFIGRGSTNFIKFAEVKCEKIGIKKYDFLSLNINTNGQASTVYEYTKNISDEEILIFNIDTFIKPNIINKDLIKTPLWWLTSNLAGEKWSFIKLNKNGTFKTSEKIRISDQASLGMYYFNSSNDFNNIYRIKSNQIKSDWDEVYIAPMYNYLDKKMSISNISSLEFNTIGTPEELEFFLNSKESNEFK